MLGGLIKCPTFFPRHKRERVWVLDTELIPLSRGIFASLFIIKGWPHLQKMAWNIMPNDPKAVQPSQPAASDTGVNSASAPSTTEEDFLTVLEAKDAELKKVSDERDNYRKGMLKAKGKLPNDEDEKVDMIRQIAREEALAIQEARLSAEKDDLIKKALRENKELKLALKNKGQVNNASIGASSGGLEPGDNILSDGQVKDLKARGWDDKKIASFKENLQKNKR